MKQISMERAIEITAPAPVALICTTKPNGGANLAPVAWWTFLESDPPMLGFSMWKGSYTHELAASTGKAAVSIPGEEISRQALQCGSVSGRDIDKASEYGIALEDAAVQFPVHSKLAFICTVENKVDAGECTFFVCRVEQTLCDEGI